MIMKKSFLVAAFVCFAGPAFAQQYELPRLSPFAKITQTVGLTDITVNYSSPGVRGRKIFGGLVPFGEVWRAGANTATVINFGKDVTINGTAVPAGDYALFVIPNKAPGNWTVILNKETKQWGAFAYKKEADFLRVDVKPVAIADHERLTYSFPDFNNDQATLAIEWEKTRVPLTIKLGTAQQVAGTIKGLEENPESMWTQAARYELEQTKDYDHGMKLVDKSIAIQESWLNDWTKAQLLAAKGDKKNALQLAKKADELGGKTPQRYFFKDEVQKALTDWKAAK
jgi:Protein of unknown function (DUF2911)